MKYKNKPPGIHDADMEAMDPSIPGVPITPELLESVRVASDGLDTIAEEWMTVERAQEVRRLRVDDGLTWRSVAAAVSEEWDNPTSSQLLGVSLCEVAAKCLDEDGRKEPWN